LHQSHFVLLYKHHPNNNGRLLRGCYLQR
jgi:hypothetical protein